MGSVLAQLLPFAVGVAVSPVPVLAVVGMLLSPRAGGAGAGLLVGWLLGIVVVTVVALVLADAIEPSDDGLAAAVRWGELALGALLLVLAVQQWRSRPRAGGAAQLPRWMSAIDRATPVRALGLGAALSGLNPKNVALCLAAGSSIGAADLTAAGTVVTFALFTVMAASTVAFPVLAYAMAADRMRRPLDALRRWLVAKNAAVMAVLLVVVGVLLLGNGLGGVS